MLYRDIYNKNTNINYITHKHIYCCDVLLNDEHRIYWC